jgi:hypothetical protein
MTSPDRPTASSVWLRFGASLVALAAGVAAVIVVILLARDTLG